MRTASLAMSGAGHMQACTACDIEIVGRPKPGVTLSGTTKAWAERVGAGAIELSMTHSRDLAQAVCVVSDV